MKLIRLLALGLLLFLLSCQSQSSTPAQITIIDGEQIKVVQTTERVPLVIVTQAGFIIMPDDLVTLNGTRIPLDQPISSIVTPVTLQLRHAVTLSVITPNGQQDIRTTARTVGEALYSTGLLITASDLIEPPANTAITKPLTVTFTPARDLTVSVDGKVLQIKSSAGTVGQALASAGIPLLGLDYSSPSESEALPADGQIQIVRVSESLVLIQKAIPYESDAIENPELELGVDQVLDPGEKGLSVSRVRIRYENGKEVSRKTESDTVVRPPKKRMVAIGTKIVLKTVTIDGVTIQYWRAISMFATSYSPCKSGVPGKCFSGTSLGLPVKKGVVAMKSNWFNALGGVEVFVPGYGRAVVADIGGGYPDGRAWIDLGYSDSDWQQWGEWVTVYFLAPAPASIPYVLQ